MSNAMDIARKLIDGGITHSHILQDMGECGQNNPHHYGSVWEHTLDVIHVIDSMEENGTNLHPYMYVAGLLHDCGKPYIKAINPKTGFDTFYGHEKLSAALAEYIIKTDDDFKYMSHDDIEFVCKLIKHHDLAMHMTITGEGDKYNLPVTSQNVQKRIDEFKLTKYELINLLYLCEADIMAQSKVAKIGNLTTTRKDKLAVVNAIRRVMEDNDLQYCE